MRISISRISIAAFVWTLLFASVVSARTSLRPSASPNIVSYETVPDGEALTEAAQHQFGSGNYSAAIATLQSVISQSPASAPAFYWLGRCYYEIHDYDHAVANGEKSVALDPKNSVYQQWLGQEYGGKADRDKSFFVARKVKKQFEQAVQLDPSNIAARRDLEEFCVQAPWIVGGNADEAKAQVDAIAAIDPIEGHLARAVFDARVFEKAGRWPRANTGKSSARNLTNRSPISKRRPSFRVRTSLRI